MRGPTEAPSRRAAAISSPYLFLCTRTRTAKQGNEHSVRERMKKSQANGAIDIFSCQISRSRACTTRKMPSKVNWGRRDERTNEPPRRRAPRRARRCCRRSRAWSACRRCSRRRAGKRPPPTRPAPRRGWGKPAGNDQTETNNQSTTVRFESD